jgi:ABC-type transporter lipoprotein component MlaA/thioesterase domain-containing protein
VRAQARACEPRAAEPERACGGGWSERCLAPLASRASALALALALALLASACATTQPVAAPERAAPGRARERALTNSAVLGNDALYAPEHGDGFAALVYTSDPIEPVNRFSLRVTKGVLDWIVEPLALGYRALVPSVAREAVDRAYTNLLYPDRLVSLLLQARLRDGAEETGRFLVNTTVGLAGLFDPAKRVGWKPHSEDVGQAFGHWGIPAGPYLFLPLLGPSSARDTIGRVFDTALDPSTYFTGATLALGFNAFSLRADAYRDLAETEADWYVPIRTYWAIRREAEVENYTIPAAAYEASDPEPSLGVLKLAPHDPAFARRARERRVALPDRGGAKLPFSLWLQPKPAPLLFVLPGIGAHRRGGTTVAVAELAYAHGWSVAALSSVFQPEVQLTALRAPYPGYAPDDAADLRAALAAIRADLEARRPGRVTRVSLLGLSLGAAHALHIAAQSAAQPAPADDLPFVRIVAVNPPVDFLRAARRFDEFYDAPLQWPKDERDRRVAEIGKKALALFEGESSDPRLPFDRIESEFLIGINGRDAVHNALVAIRRSTGRGTRHGQQVDPARGLLLEEINHSSFEGYVRRLVLPHFLESGATHATEESLLGASGLRGLAGALASDARVRVLTNADDFLLGPDDAAWLKATLGERATVFPQGGHLGNLWMPSVQQALLDALDGEPARDAPAGPTGSDPEGSFP